MLLALYVVAIVLASISGGWIPSLVRLTHTRMQIFMSFVAGAMLGVGLLHLLPHAAIELGSIRPPVWWLTAGFLTMFFVERVFHFHHHETPADMEHQEQAALHDHAAHDHAAHRHAVHSHDEPAHGHGDLERPRLNWGTVWAGLTLHSVLDGVALAAAVATERGAAGSGSLAGLVVFLAVLLHKPFDSLTLGTLMSLGGRSARLKHLVNGLYALSVPLGVLLFQWGLGAADERQRIVVGAALAFSAGTFVCIATSDLLPELRFHAHDRIKLSLALLLGVALAAAIESFHEHDPAQERHEQHEIGFE